MLRSVGLALLVSAALASPAGAAPRWQELDGAGPAARKDHALAATSSRTVWLFGGQDARGRSLGDIWRLDVRRGSWRRVRARGPAPRFGHNLLAEPGGTLLLFGGQAGSRFFGDAWRFYPRSRRWDRIGASGPAARYGAGGAIDARSGRVFVTHGFTNAGRFDDTWSLRGGAFANISPDGGRPLERCLVQAAFHDGELFLFGGQSDPRPFRDDLWRLDTSTGRWREISPRTRPPARNRYAGAQAGGNWLIHGGFGPGGARGDLWRLDMGSGRFTRVRTGRRGPGARGGHAATAAGARVVVFGGSGDDGLLADTWVLSGL